MNRVGMSVSATGLLAYPGGDATRQLVWLDRAGSRVGLVADSERRWTTLSFRPMKATSSLIVSILRTAPVTFG